MAVFGHLVKEAGLLARRERWGISYVTLPAEDLAVCEPIIARLS